MASGVASNVCVATNYSPWIGIQVHVPAGHFRELLDKPDAVQAAGQLGRLDLLTGVLASIAILLTFAAITGFWVVRGSAIRAARKAAEDEIRQELPKLAPKLIATELKRNPSLISEAIKNDPSLVETIVEVHRTMFGSLRDDVPESVISSFDDGDGNGNRAG